MRDHHDLGVFLQTRRARISPESVGLPVGTRRRVPGLRREELARLAGISVEYYQRLEQGRAARPSDEVLDAVARVLGLTGVERDHLRTLVRRPRPKRTAADEPERARPERAGPERARPELARMLALLAAPAMVINDRFDVLAFNPVARMLFVGALEGGNLARFLFLEPAGRAFYVDWDEVAASTAGQLRVAAARRPGDPSMARLVGELSAGSPEFARLWAAGDVDLRTHGAKNLRHPALGVLTFTYENLQPSGEHRQRLVVLTPVPDGPTEAALQLLASWADSDRDAARAGRSLQER
ncbi:helix-turn-helix domain-containing protein [Actinomadura rupiterrae]|uniref:helix-turn-helix domain-containing protein n=1 Tax=Actinomadura rupiterrae TaxID=559627 RepID=UPI0020A2F6A0|nr:helix-turn-helix transcriptional regulator [Actinomadura rupiterrae]MCP2342830.1 transcriptional regulator with XRE-family HTH domain [Actinomadura rupiterrae]